MGFAVLKTKVRRWTWMWHYYCLYIAFWLELIKISLKKLDCSSFVFTIVLGGYRLQRSNFSDAERSFCTSLTFLDAIVGLKFFIYDSVLIQFNVNLIFFVFVYNSCLSIVNCFFWHLSPSSMPFITVAFLSLKLMNKLISIFCLFQECNSTKFVFIKPAFKKNLSIISDFHHLLIFVFVTIAIVSVIKKLSSI